MEQSSTGLPWVRALARTMRRAAWVPAQSEGSLGATRVGECRTGVAFLQASRPGCLAASGKGFFA